MIPTPMMRIFGTLGLPFLFLFLFFKTYTHNDNERETEIWAMVWFGLVMTFLNNKEDLFIYSQAFSFVFVVVGGKD